MHSCVQLNLGILCIDTEELSEAEKHLNKCSNIVEDKKNIPEIASITLCMFNHLGILWSKREASEAKLYLEQAENFYKEFKESGNNPIDMQDLFVPNIESYDIEGAWIKFEKFYSLTLYYLAQIYGLLGDSLKSAVYCHRTLKRQLESKDYEPIDWALNTATLSQFFMEKNGFKQARHHLAASSYMLSKYEAELREEISNGNVRSLNENNTVENRTENNSREEISSKEERFKHRSADIARCWAKYGLLLLSSSKERLLKHSEDIDMKCELSTDLAKLKLEDESTVTSNDLKYLFFPTLDLTEIENQITDQFILIFEDAKKVFLNIQKWLGLAQSYYTLETLASDYIEIVQDQSQMYEALLFFDENPEDRAKMYKRSADLLEAVVKEVSPNYYLNYCRQIWFRLGEIYTEILDIKMEKLREGEGRPSPHALTKINNLVEKSMANYRNFLKTFKDDSEEYPKFVTEDLRKSFLMAHIHIAALYNRYIILDKEKQIKYCELSLEEYQKIKDYCEKDPKAAESIPNHLVKEMIELLPLKIVKLKNNMHHHHH